MICFGFHDLGKFQPFQTSFPRMAHRNDEHNRLSLVQEFLLLPDFCSSKPVFIGCDPGRISVDL